MSFLYKNRAKVQQPTKKTDSDSEDDDIDVDQMFTNPKSKKRSTTKSTISSTAKRHATQVISNSSSSSDKPITTVDTTKVIDLDHNDDDGVEAQVKAQLEKLQQTNGTSSSLMQQSLSPTFDDKNTNDPLNKSLLDMKKRIESSRQRITNVSHVQQAQDSVVIDLSSSSSLYIPQVKSAQEREKEAAKLLEEKNKALKAAANKHAKTTAGSAAAQLDFSEDEGGNSICIKVRLGSHQKEWKMPANCPFSNLKKRLSTLYNIPEAKLHLNFDGSILKDKSTPENEGMEDEDLLDIQIEKALVANAIEHAKKLTSQQSNPQPSSSSSGKQPAVEEEDDDNLICVKTRLGTDVRDWNVSTTSQFLKLKKRLAQHYNLADSKINITFDGSIIKDSDTFEDAGIEDEDLLDIKVDKNLINKAIDYAKQNAKK